VLLIVRSVLVVPTTILELLALLRRQQRVDLVLGTNSQDCQLAVSFRGAVGQTLHLILVVLWRLVDVVERLVSFAKRLALLTHRRSRRVDNGEHLVLLLIGELQTGQERWQPPKPKTASGEATEPGARRRRTAKAVEIARSATAVMTSIWTWGRRRKAGQRAGQQDKGSQNMGSTQNAVDLHYLLLETVRNIIHSAAAKIARRG
jgi:hypothetical protein